MIQALLYFPIFLVQEGWLDCPLLSLSSLNSSLLKSWTAGFYFCFQTSNFFLLRCLDSVPQSAIDYFKESAQLLIEEKGPVNALAAALAHISGATSIEQRSLLNSDVVSVHGFQVCLWKSKNKQLAPRCLNGESFMSAHGNCV